MVKDPERIQATPEGDVGELQQGKKSGHATTTWLRAHGSNLRNAQEDLVTELNDLNYRPDAGAGFILCDVA
jgi:hypothetical protein